MSSTLAMFTRSLRQAGRQAGVAFGQPTLPALLIGTIFTALFRGVARLPRFPVASYDDWVLPGTLFLTAVVGAGFAAAEVLRDLDSGFADRVRLTGARPAGLVAGRAGLEVVRTAVAASVVLVVSVGRGAHVPGGLGGAVVAVALTAAFAFAWNGIFVLSAVTTRNRAAVLGLQPLFFPAMLFSTWFGPRLLMPHWFAEVARRNPITWQLEGVRSVLAGRPDSGYLLLALTFVGGLAAVTYGLAARALERIDT